MKALASLFVLVLVVASPGAQEQTGKIYTPADFEKFIHDDLGKEFKRYPPGRPQGSPNVPEIEYSIKDGFHADFNVVRKSLVFYEKYKFELDFDVSKTTQDANLKKWNDKAVNSRAYLTGYKSPGDDRELYVRWVRFEGQPISLANGVSHAQLKELYKKLDAEFNDFILFMQGMNKDGSRVKKSR